MIIVFQVMFCKKLGNVLCKYMSYLWMISEHNHMITPATEVIDGYG